MANIKYSVKATLRSLKSIDSLIIVPPTLQTDANVARDSDHFNINLGNIGHMI